MRSTSNKRVPSETGVDNMPVIASSRLATNSAVSFVCVGTPSERNGGQDLAAVRRVAEQIGEALRDKAGRHVVVVRSTVLPGTVETVVRPALEKASGKRTGPDFGLCFQPEFLREGSSIRDYDRPPFTIVGADSEASIEPLRSRTVLQIMDGIRGVWHGGPFARTTKYVFYPKQIMFATDPVAIDRLLLDIIENERKARGVRSIWDRSPESLKMDDTRARDADPNVNIIIREPGHIEYASTLGLGVHDLNQIRMQTFEV